MRPLKITFLLFCIYLTTSFSCKKETTLCGCGKENPIKSIEWLDYFIHYYENDKSQNWDEVNLYMYDYKNSNAFIFETKRIGAYDLPTSIFDCEGKTIFICGGLQPPQLDSCSTFYKSASNEKLLWSKKY